VHRVGGPEHLRGVAPVEDEFVGIQHVFEDVLGGVVGGGTDTGVVLVGPPHDPEVGLGVAHHQGEGVVDAEHREGGLDADDLVQLQRADLGRVRLVVDDVDALENVIQLPRNVVSGDVRLGALGLEDAAYLRVGRRVVGPGVALDIRVGAE